MAASATTLLATLGLALLMTGAFALSAVGPLQLPRCSASDLGQRNTTATAAQAPPSAPARPRGTLVPTPRVVCQVGASQVERGRGIFYVRDACVIGAPRTRPCTEPLPADAGDARRAGAHGAVRARATSHTRTVCGSLSLCVRPRIDMPAVVRPCCGAPAAPPARVCAPTYGHAGSHAQPPTAAMGARSATVFTAVAAQAAPTGARKLAGLSESFPTFVIGGVQKGGTTALHALMNKLPEVCLPRSETHYFDAEVGARNHEGARKTEAWYRKLCGAGGKRGGVESKRKKNCRVCGETTPSYTLGFSLNAKGPAIDSVRRMKQGEGMQGEILLGMDLLSEEDLAAALREQAEEKLYEIFAWRQGSFRFQRGARVARANTLALDRSPANVIFTGVR